MIILLVCHIECISVHLVLVRKQMKLILIATLCGRRESKLTAGFTWANNVSITGDGIGMGHMAIEQLIYLRVFL